MSKTLRNHDSEERHIDGRVFISGIKNVSKKDVQDWMSKYGKIMDIIIFERHMLVQFDREGDAAMAICREEGETFHGFKFDIRYAYSSDGSMTSKVVVRSRSPRNISYNRDSTDISPNYREFGIDRSLDRDRNYQDYERPRIINEENSRNITRSDIPNDSNWESPIVTAKVTPERPNFDAAIIIMSSDLLNYAETIDLKLKHLVSLTTHIIVLKEENHANACVEDLEKKGVLYVFLINNMNEKHLSCTLRILHGGRQEHRNMLLTIALNFVQRNFEEYQILHKDLISSVPKQNFDPSRMPPGFAAPDDKIIYQLHLLADSRMLTLDELNDVDEFIQRRINILSKAEGFALKPNGLSIARDDRVLSANQMTSNVLKPTSQFSNNIDNDSLLNSNMDTFVKENEAILSANNPVQNSKAHLALDTLMQSQFRTDQIDSVSHNFSPNHTNNPYMTQNMIMNMNVGMNQNMNTAMYPMNINRVQNLMTVPVRGMQPGISFPNNYSGYFQQSVSQPMYRPRQQFQPRSQYPGY